MKKIMFTVMISMIPSLALASPACRNEIKNVSDSAMTYATAKGAHDIYSTRMDLDRAINQAERVCDESQPSSAGQPKERID
ncbi:MAG: hypothetical protein KA715_08900 [Xanthomonadaceae bacterium]|nr:hypothetical protein [Xanthomonadaceae bacterium]